ncbi:hypothetical protein DB345_04565 [Spartobacteria bacterium LR76]|jgi:hypothetical protein|uniref:HMA domain-containing protein n=1 Tax=Terrimicrobium sacchariphilum TaxID=690879 RepID=A0A146GB25_TERSA|nr:heavy-metal-associated domain-containing protein [Terrimicrobium sacchariphilum]PTX98116.1 hypothetical protein DB345_04565 [Spartobacteria bacterium LR76]GAT34815.1 hypothetical protein TSACC_23249 [Terrimicrobium sacchariphilum]
MKHHGFDELDLMIPELHDPEQEARAGAALRGISGIESVRFVTGGALVTYRADSVSKDEICHTLRQAGFRASTFQDSFSGATGVSSD